MSTACLEAIEVLNRDVVKAIKSKDLVISRQDVRALVDFYYQIQEKRKGLGNQVRSAEKDAPSETLAWFFGQEALLEKQIVRVLNAWAEADPVSAWALSITGIGGVLAAGLAAHIDITKAKTAGAIWSFAGLNPSAKWLGKAGAAELIADAKKEKLSIDATINRIACQTGMHADSVRRFADQYGEGKITWESLRKAASRCPWNAGLKCLCWKIGDSFVKNSGRDVFYSNLYLRKKEEYVTKNAAGNFANTAADTLAAKKFRSSETKDAYETGHLPAGRIDLMARRYAVKIFLAHYFEVAYRETYHADPPAPYAIAHLDHAHWIPVPGPNVKK